LRGHQRFLLGKEILQAFEAADAAGLDLPASGSVDPGPWIEGIAEQAEGLQDGGLAGVVGADNEVDGSQSLQTETSQAPQRTYLDGRPIRHGLE
jgi:hypothetical protein